jgi:hypothetical protein
MAAAGQDGVVEVELQGGATVSAPVGELWVDVDTEAVAKRAAHTSAEPSVRPLALQLAGMVERREEGCEAAWHTAAALAVLAEPSIGAAELEHIRQSLLDMLSTGTEHCAPAPAACLLRLLGQHVAAFRGRRGFPAAAHLLRSFKADSPAGKICKDLVRRQPRAVVEWVSAALADEDMATSWDVAYEAMQVLYLPGFLIPRGPRAQAAALPVVWIDALVARQRGLLEVMAWGRALHALNKGLEGLMKRAGGLAEAAAEDASRAHELWTTLAERAGVAKDVVEKVLVEMLRGVRLREPVDTHLLPLKALRAGYVRA